MTKNERKRAGLWPPPPSSARVREIGGRRLRRFQAAKGLRALARLKHAQRHGMSGDEAATRWQRTLAALVSGS